MPNIRGRVLRALVGPPLTATVLVLALAVSSVAAAPVGSRGQPGADGADAPRQAKVVIIVGPTGRLTNGFRAEAEAAARIARRYTSDVTTIYSPWATWAAVKPALQGANLVIYMGHGNGWPSIYRDSLYRPSQNGLGLNPVAGGDDHVHRYYGEKYLARDVRLAPGAIVLLHHLCYAAGNSEPGLPEGPHSVAKQRVENYAAGWLAAGANAVVAEAYFAPAYYVRHVLRGKRTIEDIWNSSPTFRNNVDAWASRRTDNATAFIDPTNGGRYGRSLVVVGSKVRLPAGSPSGSPSDENEPTDDLVDLELPPPPPPLAGITFGQPETRGSLVSWSSVELKLPYELTDGAAMPQDVMIGAEWQPVELDGGPTSLANVASQVFGLPLGTDVEEETDEQELATADLAPMREEEPDVDEEADSSADEEADASDEEADASDEEATADADDQADAEVDGLREPLPAEVKRRSLRVSLLTPELPGLYELSLSLHDADGELLVPEGEPINAPQLYVARPLSAAFSVPTELEATAGESVALSLTLGNNGIESWQQSEEDLIEQFGPDPFRSILPLAGQLVGYVVRKPSEGEAVTVPEAPLFAFEVRVEPGDETTLNVITDGPGSAGEYLLLLDVETPSAGSLAATGVPAAVIELHVGPAPLPPTDPVQR